MEHIINLQDLANAKHKQYSSKYNLLRETVYHTPNEFMNLINRIEKMDSVKPMDDFTVWHI